MTTTAREVERLHRVQARPVRFDAVTLLIVVVALLYILPPRLVVSGFGAAGRPAQVAGFALFVWWLTTRCFPALTPRRGPQPVRLLVGGYLLVSLVTYVAGYQRGLPPLEASSADRLVLVTIGLAGIALVAADGIANRRRLDRLLVALIVAGAFMAIVGYLQFFLGFHLEREIRIPGLALNSDPIGASSRGAQSFARIAGTAGHYIEFGVLLAMILPLAIHYALHGRAGGQRQFRWLLVGLIALAIPLAISRSGILALVVGLAVLAAIWTLRVQLTAAAIGLGAVVLFQVVQPGLLGTIRSLFENAENDPSIQHRTSDYATVAHFFSERPWFGRGAGTFLPDHYLLLDNQFLGTLVSSGIIGVLALAALFFGSYALARRVRKHVADEESAHLGQSLAASIAVALVSSFAFDSLSFTTFAGTLFLLVGAIGALWRLTVQSRPG